VAAWPQRAPRPATTRPPEPASLMEDESAGDQP
jgi:hypothetical protein